MFRLASAAGAPRWDAGRRHIRPLPFLVHASVRICPLLVAVLLGSCGPDAPRMREAGPAKTSAVDSIFPMAEQLRRLRATIAVHPDTFTFGAPSRGELARRFVRAVARRDTAELVRLALDRAEFAWLFFEHHPYAKPPYESPPALLWYQITNESDQGVSRLLERFGGAVLALRQLRCPSPVERYGPVMLQQGCVLRVSLNGKAEEGRFFGSMVGRDGRYKFLSYANKL